MSTKKALSQSGSRSASAGAARIHLDAATLHHAYCIAGDKSAVLPAILDAVAHDLALPAGNSDLLLLDYASLAIDDARDIRRYASTRPNGERRAIVISANAINREAQNALLKSFEDPGEGLHFFLIIPSAHILLPTLRSRLSFIDTDFDPKLAAATDTDAADFIFMPYKDRLEWIKDLADDIKDGKRTKQEGIEMLKSLQRMAAEKFPPRSNSALHKELVKALSYATDTSASLKMLFEHVALVMPTSSHREKVHGTIQGTISD